MKLTSPFKSVQRIKVLVLDTYGVYKDSRIESAHLRSACAYTIEGEVGQWIRLNKRWRFLYDKKDLTPELSSHFGEYPFVCLRDGRTVFPESIQPFDQRFGNLLAGLAAHAPSEPSQGSSEDTATSLSVPSPPKKSRRRTFPCPFCRREIEAMPPTVCPNCKTGIPADAKDVSLRWPEHRNRSPDNTEGNDGRHIADS